MNPKDAVGVKKAALRFVPPALAIEASGPMADGAAKYGPFNWRDMPVEVVSYIEAVFRHLYAYLDGQDNAEDSGHSHIGHAIAGLGIVADATANGTLIDNRFAKGPAADMLRERDRSANAAVPRDAEQAASAEQSLQPEFEELRQAVLKRYDQYLQDEAEAEAEAEFLRSPGFIPLVELNRLVEAANAGNRCCGFTEGHDLGCSQWR